MSEESKKLQEELLPDTLQASPNPPDFYRSPAAAKERGAAWVAKGLVLIFGGMILACLVGGFTLIGLHPPASGGSDSKDTIVSLALLPLFQGIGTFASTVFGPLLAFVLGYYFGEKKQEQEKG